AVFKDGSSGKNYKLDGGYFDIERFSAEVSEGDVLSAVISHGKVVSLSKGESVYISIDDMKDLHERLRPVSYLVLSMVSLYRRVMVRYVQRGEISDADKIFRKTRIYQ
ncbi:MAG: hypothetical protein K2N26_01215, partial [Oscillospiraceae bacterium]|nr:hypothetical protein [Oscillospiraceae bacterium]